MEYIIIIILILCLKYSSKTFKSFINHNFDLKEDKKKRYTIKKNFNKGGFGNIFLGFDNKENREVVIKKIDKAQIKDDKFNREIIAMKELKSEYSVEIYDYYNDDNFYYIVMEKCDGDLKDLLDKKKGFSTTEIKSILLQLNEVFKIMYSKNIIHRDLKPENIFIKYINNKDFIIKLGDFGTSRKYLNKDFSTYSATPSYAAPEIIDSSSNNSPFDPTKCDLWSIGVIIYELKFNKIPLMAFFAGNIPESFDDKNLNDLVEKLIVIDPSKRINWLDYFNHPFFK